MTQNDQNVINFEKLKKNLDHIPNWKGFLRIFREILKIYILGKMLKDLKKNYSEKFLLNYVGRASYTIFFKSPVKNAVWVILKIGADFHLMI